jgi:uncharacterized ParB-like nuclease family protein
VKHGESIAIQHIRQDGGTQPRATIDLEAVSDYMEAMAGGATFPPVIVFYDGTNYWLADGFHRVKAAEKSGRAEISCDLRQGTQQDAQWYSFGANKATGLRRTNQDKQRAVKSALQHPSSEALSDGQIAKHLGVSGQTVRNYRQEMGSTSKDLKSSERTGLDGRIINVSKIGKTSLAPDSAPASKRSPRRRKALKGQLPDVPSPAATGDAPDRPDPALPTPGRTIRSQRIDRLARLTLSFIEATKHLAHLVNWLGETAGEFDQAELLLTKATTAIVAVSTEIERMALAADPLNASRF